ncbi:MAG TPA: winged helix-turn-helix domain-containing protein [Pseudolabrys sp.]|nr:winged helix-turn-helix domain-containing protein [Pseudolabrys sp.]
MLILFDDFALDDRRRELRAHGVIVPIEPQVFDLLSFLIANRDRVVSKDDLIAGVWGGRIVSDSTLDSRINAARRAIGDSGKEQRFIRTFARKGIRFVGEVRQENDISSSRAPVVAAVLDEVPSPITDRPSIAVLPFENMSEDRGLELIANGLAEDIIALLARVPGFFVIARASSFAYMQRSTELRQIAEELGVRYIVTGSARASGERVRIAVQLVEAESGNQLWGSRYDVERGDTLQLQDEIARQIMMELEPALTKADFSIIRRRRTESVDAWSHYRAAAGAIAINGWNEESIAEAIRRLHQAIATDKNFALARALLALTYAFGANMSLVDDPEIAKAYAREQAERAIAIDANAPDVLGFAGCALADIGEHDRGVQLLQIAVELDPSNAQAQVALGAAFIRSGRYEEGIRSMRFGMRSSPKDFRLTFWSMILAHALACAGHYDEALAEATAAARRDGRLYGARVISAWMLIKLDRDEEARQALSDVRRLRPALNLNAIRRFLGEEAVTDLQPLWE